MGAKKKKTEEEREQEYQDYLNGPENQSLEKLYNALNAVKLDNGAVDIMGDKYQECFTALWETTRDLKVPGRKAKSFEQKNIRTMYFDNVESKSIDGKTYELSMAAKTAIYNCKMKLYEIREKFVNEFLDRNVDNYLQFKKDLVRELKDFDKKYCTHIKKKGNHDVMQDTIHTPAMTPLLLLLDKNYKFYQLEKMIENQEDIPDFRYKALEEEFSTHLTNVLDIFRDFGEC